MSKESRVRWIRAAVAVLISCVGFSVAMESVAEARTGSYEVPPYPGIFVQATPLYSETVDGWGCHFFGPCRDETRMEDDPLPIAWGSKGEHIEVTCEFGSYFLVSTDAISYVWAPRSAVASGYPHLTCSAFEWGWVRR